MFYVKASRSSAGWLWSGDEFSKKKRRLAEANRHLPVNSKSLIEPLAVGVHDRKQ
jgi:hypothetical protein